MPLAKPTSSSIGARPRLGFLVDWLHDTYQNKITEGALAAAREQNAALVCFLGGSPGTTARGEAGYRSVYDLVNADNVDALLVLGGSLSRLLGAEGIVEFLRRFKPLPICSIGSEIDNTCSLLVDNDAGMESAVSHLIRVHQLRSIAFVRGPENNQEAERRFAVYRRVLEREGIPYDDALVAPGTFLRETGQAAVARWLGERHLPLSAIQGIVAANDHMALGALDELAARGVRVPEQVAVVGFDDIDDARVATPPLTTVRQPLAAQGREAVLRALAMVHARKAGTDRVIFPAELVVRRSCGCFPEGQARPRRAAVSAAPMSFESAVLTRRQIVLAELSRAAHGALSAAGNGWESRLLAGFVDEIRGDRGAFVKIVEAMVYAVMRRRGDFSACEDVLTALRAQMLTCLEQAGQDKEGAYDLFDVARVLVASIVDRERARESVTVERRAQALAVATANIAAARDLDDLANVAARNFPALGVSRCYVAIHDDPDDPARRTHLVLAHPLPPGFRVGTLPWFDGKRTLLPPELFSRHDTHALAVVALFIDDLPIGHIVLGLGEGGYLYEPLRELISAALHRIRLVQQLGSASAAPPEPVTQPK